MLKSDLGAFSSFIDNLCKFVSGLPSCAVLINDINRALIKPIRGGITMRSIKRFGNRVV